MRRNLGKTNRSRCAEALFAAATLLAAANAAPAAVYAVSDLGLFNDAGDIGGLNNSGRVAASQMVDGAYAAMVYSGAWTNLGTLGGSESYGSGINDPLQVVGRSRNSAYWVRGFLWTPGATDGVPGNPQMKDLGTFGGDSSEAYAINSSGQVAGSAETSQGDYHAFRYSAGTMTDIGALLGNKYTYSYGYGINDAGHVAGEAYNAQWSLVAFFYNGTTAVDIGTLTGRDYATAYALNNADEVVGYSATETGLEHAFRYAGGAMTDLGTLGGNYSYANAINNHGVIVGVAGIDPGNDSLNHAFIYAGGSMTDLNTLLDASGAGWTLVQASDINDAGQIVGLGLYYGVPHGFLLTPVPQITQQPTNLTVACGMNAEFSVTATPSPLSCQWYNGTPPAGSAIAGATNLTLTVSNATGLQSGDYYAIVANSLVGATSSVATLTVLDSTPPVLSGCPGNLTNYIAPGASHAVVTWANPTATDDCDGVVPVVTSPANGSIFGLGVTPVSCQATDSSGNSNSCPFSVSVFQAQPPIITAIQVQGADVLLSFTTQAGAHYAIDCRESLVTGSWDTVMADIIGTGGIVTVTNVGAATFPSRAYRVQLTLLSPQVASPVITAIQVQGSNVLLSFTTQDGVRYAIEGRDDPTTGPWTTVMTDIIGNGGTVTVSNFDPAPAPARFYRVRAILP